MLFRSDAFSDSDGGVTVTLSDAAPEAEVTMTVTHAQGQVSRFEVDKTANEDGTAVFRLHPEGKAVLGTYNVSVAIEDFDEELTGTFQVVTNGTDVERDDDEDDAQVGDEGGSDDGSDSGDNGSGDNGSGGGSDDSRSGNAADLPRTGTELTGVALGAGLLVVGAAAVVLTRRRGAQSDPADF